MKPHCKQKVTGGVILLFAMAVLTLLIPRIGEAQVQHDQATLSLAVGNVEVQKAGQTSWQRAVVGAKLSQGDEVRAAANSEAELILTDGSVLKVLATTRVQVRQLDVDAGSQARTSFFHLLAGRVRAVVARAAVTLVSARQGGFMISTPTAVAAVRGSDGVVSYNPATQTTSVISFSGVWAFGGSNTTQMAYVNQGQIAQSRQGGVPSTPAPVPANIQAAVLRNAPIRTQTSAPVVVSPVAAAAVVPVQPGPAAPAAGAPTPAAPGAPAAPTTTPAEGAAPAAPAVMTIQEMVTAIPSAPPAAAPPPPPAQVTVIAPTVTNIPVAVVPTQAEVTATQSSMTAATATIAPPPAAEVRAVNAASQTAVVSTPPPATASAPPVVAVTSVTAPVTAPAAAPVVVVTPLAPPALTSTDLSTGRP